MCTTSSIASFARMMEWNAGLRHGARQVSRTASRSRFTASPWILLIGSVLSSTSRPEAGTSQLGEVSNHLLSQIEQRELAEAELQQLQRLDAIGQITSGVAHDFNNLLSVVLTNANLLLRNVRNPDDQEGLDLIRAAAERGCRMGKAAVQPQTALMNAQSPFA